MDEIRLSMDAEEVHPPWLFTIDVRTACHMI
jgi:hypothetical protein